MDRDRATDHLLPPARGVAFGGQRALLYRNRRLAFARRRGRVVAAFGAERGAAGTVAGDAFLGAGVGAAETARPEASLPGHRRTRTRALSDPAGRRRRQSHGLDPARRFQRSHPLPALSPRDLGGLAGTRRRRADAVEAPADLVADVSAVGVQQQRPRGLARAAGQPRRGLLPADRRGPLRTHAGGLQVLRESPGRLPAPGGIGP